MRGGEHTEGMEFLRDQLRDFLPREVNALLKRTVTKIAAEVRDDIRRNAPVRRGVLRKGITSRRERGNRDEALASVYITKGNAARWDAWYWHFVEFGTQSQPARPFVGPAFERARATFRRRMGQEVLAQAAKQLAKRAASQGRAA